MKTVASSRANSLSKLRDLIVLGVSRSIETRGELEQAAKESQIFRRGVDAREYSYSSVYRFVATLKFLHFDLADGPSGTDRIVWSAAAQRLAEHGAENYLLDNLAEPEKEILRNQILGSDAYEQFLLCFCNSRFEPRTRARFIECAVPVYVRRLPEESVQVSVDPESSGFLQKPEMEFLYTYRLWCLDVDLIDELNVREFRRFGIRESYKHVLFPVNPSARYSPKEFLRIIYEATQYNHRSPQSIPIPWLMYQICPERGLPVARFHEILLESCRTYRTLLHLERGSGIMFRGRYSLEERESRDRYGNHRYYPVVSSTLRSHLLLLPQPQIK